MFIYPYKTGSKSVKALRDGLNSKIIKLEGSKFKGSSNKVVINWGNSNMNDEILKCKVLNKPDAISLATNKRTFFEHVSEHISVPEFTTSREEAERWVNDGKIVVVREKLTGHSGEGIVILDNVVSWQDYNHSRARLYVMYIPKKDEFRVHVMGDEVIDVQRKAKRSDFSSRDVNWKVRNHANGFIYMREGVEVPDDALQDCIKAVSLCGLDFGAVDVIWNNHRNKGYVLEINTAPGLEGQTLENYIEGLDNLMTRKTKSKSPFRQVLDQIEVEEIPTPPSPRRRAMNTINEELTTLTATTNIRGEWT